MRALLAALLVPLLCNAAGLEVAVPLHALAHPAKAVHSLPAGRRWLALADLLLEDANTVDYITTRRGAFPGTGGCELNPLLTTAPCRIDVARFTAVKLAIAAFGTAQLAPVFTGWGGETYIRALALIDLAIAIPLVAGDVNNIVQLTK